MKDYFLVAKPWIVLANVISAGGGFFLAAHGQVGPAQFLPVVVGLSCVVASGCVFNNVIDRDMDREMARTCHRALATGAISLKGSLVLATVLGLAGAAILWAGTNPLTLAIVLAGFAIYVGVYSLFLKRHSVYGTLIGSLAGAAPPLAAYCAVSHRLDLGAGIVLAVFSLWQIPHAYAIAIHRYADYAAVAVPVLPVASGIPATKRRIVWHIAAFLLAAQMLTVGGYAGYAYLGVATALGLAWLFWAWSGLATADDRRWARQLYIFSIVTIVALSLMMAGDATLPPAGGAASL
jgi:protoheme IX farnesyltransferase